MAHELEIIENKAQMAWFRCIFRRRCYAYGNDGSSRVRLES